MKKILIVILIILSQNTFGKTSAKKVNKPYCTTTRVNFYLYGLPIPGLGVCTGNEDFQLSATFHMFYITPIIDYKINYTFTPQRNSSPYISAGYFCIAGCVLPSLGAGINYGLPTFAAGWHFENFYLELGVGGINRRFFAFGWDIKQA